MKYRIKAVMDDKTCPKCKAYGRCCAHRDGERYNDPEQDLTHTKDCIEEEIQYLEENCDPNFERKSGLTTTQRIEQLKELIK